MLKGKAKDAVRNGILLVLFALAVAFFSRNLVFNYAFGAHHVRLDEFKSSHFLFEYTHVEIEADVMTRLPFAEYMSISGPAPSVDWQKENDYTQTNYWLLKSGTHGMIMESRGAEKLTVDSSQTIFAPRYDGVLTDFKGQDELAGYVANNAADFDCSVHPLLLSRKADTVFHAIAAWALLLFCSFFFVKGATLLVRGIVRLRQD